MTFESTLPLGEPELMRVSAFERYLDELRRETGDDSLTRLSSLNPSLLQDLLRFEQDGRRTELLEVIAACARHGRPLAVFLQCGLRVVPLTVFPNERLVHCPLPMHEFLSQRLGDLTVLRVEPATLRPPGDPEEALVGEPHLYQPLGPVTWELAMRGSREALLPEIAGPAAYRVALGTNLREVVLTGVVQAAVTRLQRESANLREIAEWPGLNRARAMRLLNALYLQGGLIVSRTHPVASNESWFGNTRG
ncbi:MAG TPA: hypothetical protein VFQ20_05960 [Burkholderiaceae bacterium]|nr:hypothetical protein [Burkholderiaceae bacterium]